MGRLGMSPCENKAEFSVREGRAYSGVGGSPLAILKRSDRVGRAGDITACQKYGIISPVAANTSLHNVCWRDTNLGEPPMRSVILALCRRAENGRVWTLGLN